MCFIKASVCDILQIKSSGSSPQRVKEAPVEFSAGSNVEVAHCAYRRDSELEVRPHHMTFQKNGKSEMMIPNEWES